MSANLTTLNPFVPGDGQVPPLLAGREREQEVLLNFLARIRSRRPPPRNVVIYGPRGNGKTALLRWFEKECRGSGVESLWLTPTAIASLDALATALIPPMRFPSLLPDAMALGVGVAQASWRFEGRCAALARLLAKRCRKTPVVLLLDEAHRLDIDVGEALFNTSQEVRSAAPFLLVLAGTPHLEQHLGAMNATFWSRCERLGVGRLAAEASADAVATPLAEHGIEIDAHTLAQVVSDSQGYPYFVQLWGEALWECAAANGWPRLTQDDFAVAKRSVGPVRGNYYADLFRELKAKPLRSLAAAFQSRKTLPDAVLDQVAERVADDPDAMLASLAQLGYIWAPPGQKEGILWEPGIPSLMDYVLRQRQQAPAPNAQELAP